MGAAAGKPRAVRQRRQITLSIGPNRRRVPWCPPWNHAPSLSTALEASSGIETPTVHELNGATYNEIDPFAADWLERLIDAGHIAPGIVYRRSITALAAHDVAGPGQRHFFAGIGVWSYALRLAGVPDDADIWTGSCPCQPFSDAGARTGTDDDRHLWPEWFRLIRECRPAVVFGEQVASRDGLDWLDAVYADLEGAGYAVGSADLCAASVGAPHRRQRFYFVAYAREGGRSIERAPWLHADRQPRHDAARRGTDGELADHGSDRRQGRELTGSAARAVGGSGELGDAAGVGGGTRRLDQSHRRSAFELDRPGATRGFWADAEWIWCRDPDGDPRGRWRPVEPGAFPLAHGVADRVGRLRGYGNAIVAPLAAAFVAVALDAIAEGIGVK
jgi:DNA (cytosine-5)-methyltransferase 1